MAESVHVAEVRIHRKSPAHGDVVLSNGQTLGKVRGVSLVANAGGRAELVLTLDAVTVQIDGQGEGRGQTLAPSGT